MMWVLAKQISTPADLRTLGILGLGVSDPTIGKNLQNTDDINEAAYQVLRTWRLNQDNWKVAYTNLCDALRKPNVGMVSFIEEVLEVHWKRQTKINLKTRIQSAKT